jgi:hypothetical protein
VDTPKAKSGFVKILVNSWLNKWLGVSMRRALGHKVWLFGALAIELIEVGDQLSQFFSWYQREAYLIGMRRP